eukprot:COSAG06_NODE_631_length_13616_cov_6.997411_5_plen_1866_part_00
MHATTLNTRALFTVFTIATLIGGGHAAEESGNSTGVCEAPAAEQGSASGHSPTCTHMNSPLANADAQHTRTCSSFGFRTALLFALISVTWRQRTKPTALPDDNPNPKLKPKHNECVQSGKYFNMANRQEIMRRRSSSPPGRGACPRGSVPPAARASAQLSHAAGTYAGDPKCEEQTPEKSNANMHLITFMILLMVSFAPAAVAASLAAAKVPDAQCVSLEPLSLQEHVSPSATILSLLPVLGGMLLLLSTRADAHWLGNTFVLWTTLTAIMIAYALGIAVLTASSDTIQSSILVAITSLPGLLQHFRSLLMSPLFQRSIGFGVVAHKLGTAYTILAANVSRTDRCWVLWEDILACWSAKEQAKAEDQEIKYEIEQARKARRDTPTTTFYYEAYSGATRSLQIVFNSATTTTDIKHKIEAKEGRRLPMGSLKSGAIVLAEEELPLIEYNVQPGAMFQLPSALVDGGKGGGEGDVYPCRPGPGADSDIGRGSGASTDNQLKKEAADKKAKAAIATTTLCRYPHYMKKVSSTTVDAMVAAVFSKQLPNGARGAGSDVQLAVGSTNDNETPPGFMKLENAGGGNCMFHACNQALGLPATSKSSQELRKRLGRQRRGFHLPAEDTHERLLALGDHGYSAEERRFIELMSQLSTYEDSYRKRVVNHTVQHYFTRMERNGEDGGELELCDLSALLKRQVRVYYRGQRDWQCHTYGSMDWRNQPGVTIHLLYTPDGLSSGHYEALVRSDGQSSSTSSSASTTEGIPPQPVVAGSAPRVSERSIPSLIAVLDDGVNAQVLNTTSVTESVTKPDNQATEKAIDVEEHYVPADVQDAIAAAKRQEHDDDQAHSASSHTPSATHCAPTTSPSSRHYPCTICGEWLNSTNRNFLAIHERGKKHQAALQADANTPSPSTSPATVAPRSAAMRCMAAAAAAAVTTPSSMYSCGVCGEVLNSTNPKFLDIHRRGRKHRAAVDASNGGIVDASPQRAGAAVPVLSPQLSSGEIADAKLMLDITIHSRRALVMKAAAMYVLLTSQGKLTGPSARDLKILGAIKHILDQGNVWAKKSFAELEQELLRIQQESLPELRNDKEKPDRIASAASMRDEAQNTDGLPNGGRGGGWTYPCAVCGATLNSTNANFIAKHEGGKVHQAALRAGAFGRGGGPAPTMQPQRAPAAAAAPTRPCMVCGGALNSDNPSFLAIHNSGRRHQAALAGCPLAGGAAGGGSATAGGGSAAAVAAPSPAGGANWCVLCDRGFNSADQFTSHQRGKGHKEQASCEICGIVRQFATAAEREEHLQSAEHAAAAQAKAADPAAQALVDRMLSSFAGLGGVQLPARTIDPRRAQVLSFLKDEALLADRDANKRADEEMMTTLSVDEILPRLQREFKPPMQQLPTSADRPDRVLYVLNWGFAFRKHPWQAQSLQDAGYKVHKGCDGDPEADNFDLGKSVDRVIAEIERLKPLAIICASKGHHHMVELWRRGLTLPTLMINVNRNCWTTGLPADTRVILVCGQNENRRNFVKERGVDPKGISAPPVDSLEGLIQTGSPEQGSYLYYTVESGTRSGDCHDCVPHIDERTKRPVYGSLMHNQARAAGTSVPSSRFDTLPRLVDSLLGEERPLTAFPVSFNFLSEDRMRAEQYISYTPAGLKRHWDDSSSAAGCQLFDLTNSDHEYQALVQMFLGKPLLPPHYNQNCEMATEFEVTGIQRIQHAGLHANFETRSDQLRRLYMENDIPFEGGKHTKLLFHGVPDAGVATSIIMDALTGFDANLNTAMLWGKGNYFAVHSSYPAKFFSNQTPDADGNMVMLVALGLTGIPLVGDGQGLGVSDTKFCGHYPKLHQNLNVCYSSYVDSAARPEIFVLQNLDAYPAYLIKYVKK